MTKQITPQNTGIEKDYQHLVQDLKSILDKGLSKAYKAVDNIKVQTYWQIGERIVREELKYKNRAEYGKALVENLAVDLGFKKRRLHEIVQFYNIYPIVRTVSAQLGWSHYLDLIKMKKEKMILTASFRLRSQMNWKRVIIRKKKRKYIL